MSGDHLLPVEWVLLARWDFEEADTHFCIEYLDSACEIAAEDDYFVTEEAAVRHAEATFALAQWREGVPPRASA